MSKELPQRLQKIISQAGVASRRVAEELIKKGRVTVNGKKATLGDKATFKDNVLVNGVPLIKEEKVYYIINKPVRTICSLRDPEGRTLITDLISERNRIFPVGRLDYNTTGTLLLTNDGELSNRLIHPRYEIVRVYRARVDSPLNKDELNFLNSDNVIVNNKPSSQTVEKVDNKTYVISLKQGSYHHIKELFEQVDHTVINLTRIEFAGLTHVGELAKGQYRRLVKKEISWLMKLTGLDKEK